jgi:hypothetical protein
MKVQAFTTRARPAQRPHPSWPPRQCPSRPPPCAAHRQPRVPGRSATTQPHAGMAAGAPRIWASAVSRRFAANVGSAHCLQAVGMESGFIGDECEPDPQRVSAECELKTALVCEPTCHCLRAATVRLSTRLAVWCPALRVHKRDAHA